jgi:hypothetical protein
VYYDKEGTLVLEEVDQCGTCTHRERCVLLAGLRNQVILINDEYDVNVTECCFYQEKPRHLKVIK